ncbi:MAG: benzoate-CoA ligase [Oleiphilaceae bacterium]|jgi:benzoate-CoA ligase
MLTKENFRAGISRDPLSSFNATDDLLLPNILAGRGDKVAIIDLDGEHTYSELIARVNQFANVLEKKGIAGNERILLCLDDSIDFHTCFLGAIKAGVIPVPVNTLLTKDDYDFLLEDTRARILVVSEINLSSFSTNLLSHQWLTEVLISGKEMPADFVLLSDAIQGVGDVHQTASTALEDPAFWLYTSGTTGRPKAAVHLQKSLSATAKHFGQGVLNIKEDDILYSAAKLFFAYGLGNSLTFPLAAGATVVLIDAWSKPESVINTLNETGTTIFFGVPTLFSNMLKSESSIDKADCRIKFCVSAGESLPPVILEQWRNEVGIEIIDGIGSTEMLHIFMSNRVDDIQPGTSGRPVDGYEVCLLDESGDPVTAGGIGDLYVSGPSSACEYWGRRQSTAETFQGIWTKTGDKYRIDGSGYYVYCGRSDDLFKVSGQYVSPMQIENALLSHPVVTEAAVVGVSNDDFLIKPKAYVVLSATTQPSKELESELMTLVREMLSEHKRPHWIKFIQEIPKTATGKIQRFKLRELG